MRSTAAYVVLSGALVWVMQPTPSPDPSEPPPSATSEGLIAVEFKPSTIADLERVFGSTDTQSGRLAQLERDVIDLDAHHQRWLEEVTARQNRDEHDPMFFSPEHGRFTPLSAGIKREYVDEAKSEEQRVLLFLRIAERRLADYKAAVGG